MIEPAKANRFVNQIPAEILNDEELNKAIAILPSNYNFEIHKSVWHIRKSNAKRGKLDLYIIQHFPISNLFSCPSNARGPTALLMYCV